MDRFSPNQIPTYHVEHLATFSTTSSSSSSVILTSTSISASSSTSSPSSSTSSSPQPNQIQTSNTTTTALQDEHQKRKNRKQQQQHVTPRMALQRLFKMEKTSGIWTQRMAIQLKGNHMWILDGETSDVVERFPVAFIQQPTSFNDQNHIYNNILIFTVQLPNENQGELHIFQCVSHDAINVVDDIYHWMKHYGINHNHHHHHDNQIGEKINNNNNNHKNNNNNNQSGPSTNVNVKEAVNVFNQIAAQRVKKETSNDSVQQHHHHRSSSNEPRQQHQQQQPSTSSSTLIVQDLDSRSDSSSLIEQQQQHQHHHHQHQQNHRQEMASPHNHNGNHHHHHHHRSQEMHENYSNERYVSILNHCFDDIERFIIRLQHAAAALRELQIRNNKRGAKGSGDGLLAIRARGPYDEEFFDILSKFKLAFNLLAKLKGCIHDPNAPELVHFLFTPLAIIIDAARGNDPPVDPSLVGIPYLSLDAIELLSNCCTSKEYDLWQSLGINWTQSAKQIRITNPFKPIFSDGLAPDITEPELLGIILPSTTSTSSLSLSTSTTATATALTSQTTPIPTPIQPTMINSEIDLIDPDNEMINSRLSKNNLRNNNNNNNNNFDDSDYDDNEHHNQHHHHHNNNNNQHHSHHPHSHNNSSRTTSSSHNHHSHPHSHHHHGRPSPSSPIDSIERDDVVEQSSPSLLLSNNNNGIQHHQHQHQTFENEQMEWLNELQTRNAKIVRVLFPRTANNNKELTVTRGEILEILDDSRKWWKARNYRGQIAHVPHTIVGDIETNNQSNLNIGGPSSSSSHHQGPSSSMAQDDWIRRERQGKKGEFRYF